VEKIILIVLLFCGACSLAPVVSEKTARTLGDGNWETNVGMSPAVSVTVGRGFGESLDLHFSYESQIVPIVEVGGKFSIIQNNEGLSFSLFGGGFTDGGSSSGYYAGPVVSFKKNWIEFYGLAKYNNVTWEADASTDDDDSVFNFNLSINQNFDYWLAVAGVNFWFNEGFGLNINGKRFFIDDASEDGERIIPSLHLLFRY
tara:strand:+ start:14291 stop:14893 length:603 start_codon:yes stop_codon:yes gene_type:complete